MAARKRAAAPINTQCFQIQNCFDPAQESGTAWQAKLKKVLIQRVNNFGPLFHVHIDANAMNGTCYIKCGSCMYYFMIQKVVQIDIPIFAISGEI